MQKLNSEKGFYIFFFYFKITAKPRYTNLLKNFGADFLLLNKVIKKQFLHFI